MAALTSLPVRLPALGLSRLQTKPPKYGAHQWRGIAAFTVIALLTGRFLVHSEVHRSLLNEWCIYAVAALGFYLIFCVAGRFAFCQSFMMLFGAYIGGHVAKDHGTWAALVAAVLATSIFAAIFGLLLLRAEDMFFAIGTLALVQVGTVVFSNWTSFAGPNGLTSQVPAPEVFGQTLLLQGSMFWLFLPLLVLALVICALVERSPLQRDAIAARDLPEVSRACGVQSRRVTLSMFVIGSSLGGLAGGMFVLWQGAVGTDSFGLTVAIGLLLMPIVGSVDSFWGPVLGALLYVLLPQVLSGLAKYSPLVYGVVLVVTIIALPGGILGGVERMGRRLLRTARSGTSARGRGNADAAS